MMGLFGKGRHRSQSFDSVTPWPSLHNEDGETILLPGSDNVFITHTRDGKPAPGRNKSDNLLKDFGFDMLGQSLGVPSRKDFQRQTRPSSVKSQSSGLITAPVTPRRSREAQRLNNSNPVYAYEDTEPPANSCNMNSLRSCSTPAFNEMARYNHPNLPSQRQHATYKMNAPFLTPQAFNLPPPPPPPPQPVAMNWQNHSMMNSMMHSGRIPTSMSYPDATSQFTHPPSYPYHNVTAFQGAPNWATTQQDMAGQHPNPLGISLPRTTATTILPYYQQFIQARPPYPPQVQTMLAPYPVNIPPPPPPPPPPQQDWLQSYAIATGRSKVCTAHTQRPSNTDDAVKRATQIRNSSRNTRPTQVGGTDRADVRHVTKHIRHVHVCAGCGKKRSRGYHRDNPLRRGEIPKLDYCRKCIEDAEYTDPGTSNAGIAGDASFEKHPREAPTASFSTDEGRAIARGEYVFEQSRHGGRWIKKSKRRGLFSRLFSRRAGSNKLPLPPRSISTAEESRSRASSPASDLLLVRSLSKTARSSVCLSDERCNSSSIQVEAALSVLPRQRSTNVETWISKHNSPLVPRETQSGKGEDETRVETPSKITPAIAQPRTHIRSRIPRPRPRPQPEQVVIGAPMPVENNISLPILDEQSGSPCLETEGATEGAEVSQPADGKAGSKLSKQPSIAGGQAHLQRFTNERVKKAQVSSSNGASHMEAFGENRYRGAQPSRNNPPNIRVIVPSEVASEEKDNIAAHCTPTGFPGDLPVSFGHNPEVKPDSTMDSHPLPGTESCQQQVPDENPPELVHELKAKFYWEGPLTPTDLPCADGSHSPRVVSDLWSDLQTDMDREVEELAERDLAAAGKLFDSFSSTLDGSTTSTFPVASFVTRSNMSIARYDSESDMEGSESGETVKATEAKQIEFSSELDRTQKTTSLRSPTGLIVHTAPSSGSSSELSHLRNNKLYNQTDDLRDDNDFVEFSSTSPVGSSLVGHTGHSADDLVAGSMRAREYPAMTASGYCRRVKRPQPTRSDDVFY